MDEIREMLADTGLRAEVVRQANSQYENEIAEMTTERAGLERELGWHHAEMRKLAVSGATDSGTSARIADLHERIRQAQTRCKELESLVEERHKDKITEEDVATAFVNFDNVWDAMLPREQIEIIHTLVVRVDFDQAESQISVAFHPTAIRTLLKSKIGGAAA